MNTADQKPLTLEEAKEIKKKWNEAEENCYVTSIELFNKEIAWLKDIEPTVKESVDFDELILPLHNIISIVPEQQHRFQENIIALLRSIPSDIRSNNDVLYVLNRITNITKEELSSKVQITDLSQYWSAYRSFMYKYGFWDTHVTRKIQKRMQDKMVRIINDTIAKRTRGIKSAEEMLKMQKARKDIE